MYFYICDWWMTAENHRLKCFTMFLSEGQLYAEFSVKCSWRWRFLERNELKYIGEESGMIRWTFLWLLTEILSVLHLVASVAFVYHIISWRNKYILIKSANSILEDIGGLWYTSARQGFWLMYWVIEPEILVVKDCLTSVVIDWLIPAMPVYCCYPCHGYRSTWIILHQNNS